MSCQCLERMQVMLEPMNAELGVSFNVRGQVFPMLSVHRIRTLRDGKRTPLVIPTFCPFCGKRYERAAKKKIPAVKERG